MNLETAKANGLKPLEYLEFLFAAMPAAAYEDIDGIASTVKAIV